MEPSQQDFQNLATFKQLIEEAPSKENGWELVYNGLVQKNVPDCYIKVYKKYLKDDKNVTIRIDGDFKGISAEKLFKMRTDISLMVQCSTDTEVMTMGEQISPNIDIIHVEAKMPFPMSDREFLQKRLYFCNKDHPEVAKQFRFPDKDHRYYIILSGDASLPQYPIKKKPIRGHAKMNDWIMEEDPNDSNHFTFKAFANTDVAGSVPTFFLNFVGPKATPTLFQQVLKNYSTVYGKK